MGTRLNLDEYLDKVDEKLQLVQRQLEGFGNIRPSMDEQAIKFWGLMSVKMAMGLLKEAAAESKIHEEERDDRALGNSEDSAVEGTGEGLPESGGIQQRERKRDGKGGS